MGRGGHYPVPALCALQCNYWQLLWHQVILFKNPIQKNLLYPVMWWCASPQTYVHRRYTPEKCSGAFASPQVCTELCTSQDSGMVGYLRGCICLATKAVAWWPVLPVLGLASGQVQEKIRTLAV
jgi:hypothetical protein